MEYLERFLRLATALTHWTHHHSLDGVIIIVLQCNDCRDLVRGVAEFEVFDFGKDWINLLVIFLELDCLSNLRFANVNHIQLFVVISQIPSLALRYYMPFNPFLM